jgi:hypothetical protein
MQQITADLSLLKFCLNQILLHVLKWGTPIFARGGMIFRQTLLKHVWGLFTSSNRIG